jgi:hypothetical protein
MHIHEDMSETPESMRRRIESAMPDTALNDVKEFLFQKHAGYEVPLEKIHDQIHKCTSWVVEHFASGNVTEMNGGWFHPLSYGMLITLAVGDNGKFKEICQWAKPSTKPEYKGPVPDEIQKLYLVLASQFQESPSLEFHRLVDEISASKKRDVKLLAATLRSLVEKNEKGFAISIVRCVEAHAKKRKPSPDAYFMEDWFPIHANTVYLVGLALGMQRPNLPPEIAAYLMTPESIGFA